MTFKWNMKEEEWERLSHEMHDGDHTHNDDYYGQMYCGDFCVEFFLNDVGIGSLGGWTNIYRLHVDDGYGQTENGIPYSLTDACIEIPDEGSFEEFKRTCENEFTEMVKEMDLLEFADKGCEW